VQAMPKVSYLSAFREKKDRNCLQREFDPGASRAAGNRAIIRRATGLSGISEFKRTLP